jgi:hypothetical protein
MRHLALALSIAALMSLVPPLSAQTSHLNVAAEQIVQLDFFARDGADQRDLFRDVIVTYSNGNSERLKGIPDGSALVITDLRVEFLNNTSGTLSISAALGSGDPSLPPGPAVPGRYLDSLSMQIAPDALGNLHQSYTAGYAFSGAQLPWIAVTQGPRRAEVSYLRASGYFAAAKRSAPFLGEVIALPK